VCSSDLKGRKIPFTEVNIEQDVDAREFILSQGHRSVPQLYLDGKLFVEGGFQGLSKMSAQEIRERLDLTNDLGTI
jgi:glutaredoxin